MTTVVHTAYQNRDYLVITYGATEEDSMAVVVALSTMDSIRVGRHQLVPYVSYALFAPEVQEEIRHRHVCAVEGLDPEFNHQESV